MDGRQSILLAGCGACGVGGLCFLSYLVKISFVTAAMLYSSRRARDRASIRAVLPDPTGLFAWESSELATDVVSIDGAPRRIGRRWIRESNIQHGEQQWLYIPADANGERTILPVSPLDERHLAVDVGTWAIEDIVGVAVAVEGIIVGMVNSSIVGVRVSHIVML